MADQSSPLNSNAFAKWQRDPVLFIEYALVDPETGKPFVLYDAQRTFLRTAFRRTPDGRLVYNELVFSGLKKSGKSTMSSMLAIYVAVCLAPVNGQIYFLANDAEQAESRGFKIAGQILRASPLLRGAVDISSTRITLRQTGTTIVAVANDYAGFSGADPTLNIYDELAYFNSESSRRLWDEGIPSPRRRISLRLATSTAGFEGEGSPLRDLYDRGMQRGTEIAPDLRAHDNMLFYWRRTPIPEMHPEWWLKQQAQTLRPSQYRRLILNEWTASESVFIDMAEWDRCTDASLSRVLADSGMAIWVGLDVGLRHDSTAIMAVGWDGQRIRLVTHSVFTARRGETLDVESVIETAILSLKARFALVACLFDPWQAVHLGQRLARAGVNMVEFNQHLSNLSMMAANLLDLLKTGRMRLYPDAELREAAAKTIAIENSRGGWRLGKAKQSDRVDPIVSLAMAALACERAGSRTLTAEDREFMTSSQNFFHAQAERSRSMTFPSLAPPADSRLDGKGQDWADYEDRLQVGQRGRRRWGGF